jgi:hypothetical protein
MQWDPFPFRMRKVKVSSISKDGDFVGSDITISEKQPVFGVNSALKHEASSWCLTIFVTTYECIIITST